MTTRSLNGEFKITVYYEDTDFSGYVYHANYLKYFDRAREELLGLDKLKDLFALGQHFVARELKVQYLKPARLGDVMRIESRLDFDRLYVHCHHTVFKQSTGEKLVTGYVQLVTVNSQGFPIRVPAEFL